MENGNSDELYSEHCRQLVAQLPQNGGYSNQPEPSHYSHGHRHGGGLSIVTTLIQPLTVAPIIASMDMARATTTHTDMGMATTLLENPSTAINATLPTTHLEATVTAKTAQFITDREYMTRSTLTTTTMASPCGSEDLINSSSWIWIRRRPRGCSRVRNPRIVPRRTRRRSSNSPPARLSFHGW